MHRVQFAVEVDVWKVKIQFFDYSKTPDIYIFLQEDPSHYPPYFSRIPLWADAFSSLQALRV